MVRVRVRLSYTMAICLVLQHQAPGKCVAPNEHCSTYKHYSCPWVAADTIMYIPLITHYLAPLTLAIHMHTYTYTHTHTLSKFHCACLDHHYTSTGISPHYCKVVYFKPSVHGKATGPVYKACTEANKSQLLQLHCSIPLHFIANH